MEELRPGVFSLVSVLFKENINFLINQQRLFVNYSFFALFWTSELMSRETFGSDMAKDNPSQGLEYPGYTSAGKEDKLVYQSPLNRPARIFLWSETR